jgi:hypothetical protein
MCPKGMDRRFPFATSDSQAFPRLERNTVGGELLYSKLKASFCVATTGERHLRFNSQWQVSSSSSEIQFGKLLRVREANVLSFMILRMYSRKNENSVRLFCSFYKISKLGEDQRIPAKQRIEKVLILQLIYLYVASCNNSDTLICQFVFILQCAGKNSFQKRREAYTKLMDCLKQNADHSSIYFLNHLDCNC